MNINIDNMISISEANQNFSNVVKKVELNGNTIILKNNKPTYIVSKFDNNVMSENDLVELVARRIISKHKRAFEELAKW